MDLLNFIPCELDIASTLFHDTKIITYEIYLPPSGKEISFKLLYDEDFKIYYDVDTITNSPVVYQLLTQAKKKVWVGSINVEDSIISQGALD